MSELSCSISESESGLDELPSNELVTIMLHTFSSSDEFSAGESGFQSDAEPSED